MLLASCQSTDSDCQPGPPAQNIVGTWQVDYTLNGIHRRGQLIFRPPQTTTGATSPSVGGGVLLDPDHTLYQSPPNRGGIPTPKVNLRYTVEGNRIAYYILYEKENLLPYQRVEDEWNGGVVTANTCKTITIRLDPITLTLTRIKR